MPILGLPDSQVLRLAAAAGLPVVSEAFADRAYTAQGTLVPRRVAGSVLHDPAEIARRALGFAVDEAVDALSGECVTVRARSLCVHGDSPGAVVAAAAVRAALEDAGVTVGPFT